MGGRGCGPVESGTTTTVRRTRLRAFAVTTMAGRVLRISLPRAGSKLTHQISPRRTGVASGAEALIGSGRGSPQMGDRHRWLPFPIWPSPPPTPRLAPPRALPGKGDRYRSPHLAEEPAPAIAAQICSAPAGRRLASRSSGRRSRSAPPPDFHDPPPDVKVAGYLSGTARILSWNAF